MWAIGKTSVHSVAARPAGAPGFAWEQDSAPTETDSWLLSFVDVLTLLLTLFVLLLAYQKTAHEEAQGALVPVPARVVDQSHNLIPVPQPDSHTPRDGEGVTPAAGDDTTVNAAAAADITTDNATDALQPATAVADNPPVEITPHPQTQLDYLALFPADPLATSEWWPTLITVSLQTGSGDTQTTAPVATLPALPTPADAYDGLLAHLASSGLEERVEVSRSADQINLEINDNILFDAASATLTTAGVRLLDGLLPLLLSEDYQLSVEGHTDNVPIETAQYPSNWELSAARATTVTRHLIGIGLLPERVRAVGYADTRPRADNASADGRARNRRVSLVLQPLAE